MTNEPVLRPFSGNGSPVDLAWPGSEKLSEIVSQFLPNELVGGGSKADLVIVPHLQTGGYSSAKIWQVFSRSIEANGSLSGIWLPDTQDTGTQDTGTQDANVLSKQDVRSFAWCLRCWPANEPTSERLRWIHQQLEVAAKTLPQILLPLPRKTSSVTKSNAAFVGPGTRADRCLFAEGRLWQLEPWASGTNDYLQFPSDERLISVMQCLAKLHSIWELHAAAGLANWNNVPVARYGGSPGLKKRWEQAQALLRDAEVICKESQLVLEQKLLADPQELELWRVVAADTLRQWQARVSELAGRLQWMLRTHLPLSVVLADVWSDHLFFQEHELSAIIDYGAVRIDSVAADLSRVLTSLCGANPAQRELALKAYAMLRPLAAEERQAIEVFDLSSQMLGPLHWLRWIFIEQRFEPRADVRFRLRRLLDGSPF